MEDKVIVDKNYIFSFEKLDVYKETKKMITAIYLCTAKFNESEKFGLTSQLRRAAVSIASNIAEGNSRKSVKDKIHFMNMAYCSLMEVVCQLDISLELKYINNEEMDKFRNQIETIAKLINGLKNYQEKQLIK